MKQFVFFCAIVVAGIAGCVSDDAQVEKTARKSLATERFELLVGNWYGEYDDPQSGHVQHLSHHKADETYVIEFLFDGLITNFEKGTWGVDGDVYWSNYESWAMIDEDEWYPAELPVREEYKILSLNKGVFEYEHIGTGRKFKATRVGDDFAIPPSQDAVDRARTIVPMELDETARGYMEARAAELIKYFGLFCGETPAGADAITSKAEALGWGMQQESDRGNVHVSEWSSITEIEDLRNKLPLFLQVEFNKSTGGVTCAVLTFGTSNNADIGRQEFDLVRALLADTFEIGETVVMPPDLTRRNELPSYRYEAELTRPEDDRTFAYSWVLGLHGLTATDDGRGASIWPASAIGGRSPD